MFAALTQNHGLVRCPSCQGLLAGPWLAGQSVKTTCLRCASRLEVIPLVPLAQSPAPPARSGEKAQTGEATCYFHPEKRAEIGCERCGRFVCSLCDMLVASRHLCPACLASVGEKSTMPELVSSRMAWGRLALALALAPLIPLFWIIYWAAFFTAPAAVLLAIWGWRKPGSLVHGRQRWISVLAIVLGLAELTGIGLALAGLFSLFTRHG